VLWGAAAVEDARTLIDVGAGTGLITFALARLAPGAHVYAADVSPEMLDHLRARVPADLEHRITPLLARESAVPLPGGSADLVTMIALFHELDDPAASLVEALRLLRSAGRLLVADWKHEQTTHGPPVERRVPLEEMLAAVGEAGFEDVETHGGLAEFEIVTATKP
jgi:ubiquinone/menaquinone biosynthesis C-methylase UbiE